MFNTLIFTLGIVFTVVTFFFVRESINVEACLRTNYRDRKITALGGLYFLIPFLIVLGAVQIENNVNYKVQFVTPALVIVALGFAFLGLIDDLIGDKTSQGFKGHIKALLKGKLTTGGLKLIGGPAICFIALMPYVERTGYEVLILGVISISLTANLVNLLDLAPGRSLKVSSIAMLVAVILETQYSWQFGILGIFLVLLFVDLKEMMMLGDIGSNMIGAIVGLSIANNLTLNQLYAFVIILFALNLLSEFVSFSKIINSFLPLRFLDTLGQTKERKDWLKKKLA